MREKTRRRRGDYIAERSGPYRFQVVARTPHTATEKARIAEEWEMERILEAARYKMPRQYAKILISEGVRPEDLRERVRRSPGEAGSLQRTHGFERW